jgi:ABC-type sugar transport system ATPase subunit
MANINLNHVSKQFGKTPDSPEHHHVANRTQWDKQAQEFLEYLEDTDQRVEAPDRALALDDVTLSIRDGECLSVIGPSGCGKSTLLRVISGLVAPDTGELLFDGNSLYDIPPGERGIGMVFQSYALYPHLDVNTNVGFFDWIRKQEERIPERIRHISEEMNVPIKHLLSRKPPHLSGGEKQRVAIARSLARDPKLFLFDEPFSNLDAKLRSSLRVQLKRIIAKYAITTVYVTHDQQEAIALGDRIAVMNLGRIEQVGTYATLYEQPVNRFVAGFVGTPSMNFLEGVREGDWWKGQSVRVGPFRDAYQNERALTLGIRPEHIVFGEEGVQAQVERVDALYDSRQQIVHLWMGGLPMVAVTGLDTPVKVSDTRYLQFPVEHIKLFDVRTGERVPH